MPTIENLRISYKPSRRELSEGYSESGVVLGTLAPAETRPTPGSSPPNNLVYLQEPQRRPPAGQTAAAALQHMWRSEVKLRHILQFGPLLTSLKQLVLVA